MPQVILMLSVVVQFVAAGLALNLIRTTGRIRAWLFIASALLFMAVRRGIPLVASFTSQSIRIDPLSEGIGLVISLLMLMGVWMIGGVFEDLNRLHVDAEGEIGRRKQTETDLRRSEENLHVILQSMSDAVIAMDLTGQITHFNPTAERLTGWPAAEAKGRPLTEIFRIINAQTRDKMEIPLERSLREGVVVGLVNHAVLIARDGKEYRIADSCAPIRSSGGQITGTVLIFRDVTEDYVRREALRESESRLLFLSDHLPGGLVYQVDSGVDGKDRRMTYISAGVETLHEITAAEALADSSSIYVQMSEADRVLVAQREAAAISAMAPFNVEVQVNLPSGQTRWRLFASAPRRLANNHLVWDGIEIDITARKKSEEERLRLQSLESLGTVAGGIAHDFNNLLMGIFGNVELAKLDLAADHPAFASLTSAHQALETARQLTTRLLTFAKGGHPVMETVDLRQRIRDTVQFNLTGSNVAMHFDLSDDLWPVKADKGQLAQVIANLTINAKEAMPTGGNFYVQAQNMPDIRDVAAPDLHGDFVKLTFRDEGIGIPARIIERIFDPYFTTKRSGSGLGLAITHGIVLKHKGHIRVETQPNIGTTFTVFLPVDMTERPRTEPARVPVPESLPGASGHVLLMDDEELIRKITSRMLVQLGYTVETAHDGKEALLKYAAATKSGRPFDLVITDLTIPGGMGGKEAIQDLLAINPSAKVIVSSGYSSDPVLADCGQYGFSGYLAKPFQLQELKAELLRIMTVR